MTMTPIFFNDAEYEAHAREQKRIAAINEQAAPMVRAAFGNVRLIDPDFSIEEFWPDSADEPNLGNLRAPCANCGRQVYAWTSPSRTPLDSGWRWVGLSHQEPYTAYFAACGWCGGPVHFTIHAPQ